MGIPGLSSPIVDWARVTFDIIVFLFQLGFGLISFVN